MKDKNMKLWDAVEKTDISFTKTVNQRGGYTAISPQYQLMKATEQFGPYGSGFGLSDSELNFDLFESIGLVIHKAVFFYVIDGVRSEFPIHNAIEAAKTTQKGKWVDVDFAKKLETNTVSKALSKLGFNADVFMGMMEDQSYINELSNELAIQKADDKDAEIVKQRLEHENWKAKELEQYRHFKTVNALKTAYTAQARHCKRRNDEQGMKEFKREFDARMIELGGDNETA
jgi:adenylate kinase family enzyme